MLPTPTAREYRSGRTKVDYGNSRPLNEAVLAMDAHLARSTAPTDGAGVERAGSGLRLNPLFSLWLMGFPDNWLDPEGPSLAPSATQ